MRKLAVSVVTLGLAALGFALPASAHAASGCNAKWPGRDGNVRAWRDADCQGELLGVTAGNDSNWGDPYGPFTGTDANAASSVMNSGYVGGKDVVAFYYFADYPSDAYGCLKPGELYVDNLGRNNFTNGRNMNDNIMSHVWVAASACAPGSFIS
ncbi:hypothetical protein ACFV2Z_38355 [Streptomyces sp. NPDC059688]|uniref:Secreted protein n=1 Tax=Streptomyces albidocamelliae TaxID=2981135 RepID=A0ABY6EWI9_9ACTN|nr:MULTISPECIES: hypothetical protein [unclassified Streptomyces]OKJ84904.1 hypothetical protein AMK32_13105 [Streptomyces sp. CB01883]ROP46700.1 hypothetical protein EDD94_6360 [Streptomyces sp. PanSC9]UXY38779.1 hypothetical protein N8I86_31050 [Streptomyces sp. HUAS 14-6]